MSIGRYILRAVELTLGMQMHPLICSGTEWKVDLLKTGAGEGTCGHSGGVSFLHCHNIWLCWVYLGKDFIQLWFQTSMLELLVVLLSALNSFDCAP